MRKEASKDRLAIISPQLPTLVNEPPDAEQSPSLSPWLKNSLVRRP